MRRPALFLVLSCGLFSGLRAAETSELPRRLLRETNGFSIEYSAGDEAYVDALARRLPEFKTKPRPAAPLPFGLEAMEQHREELLQKIADRLGLEKPTAKMAETYDKFFKLFRLMGAMTPPLPTSYALWRRPELLARLQAGEKIPGFTLTGKNEIDFKLEFKHETPGETPESAPAEIAKGLTDAWQKVPMPLSIGKDLRASPEEEIEKNLQSVESTMENLRQVTEGEFSSPFVILHEITEAGIVWEYIGSKDRRWFCDGVANYVALKVLAEMVGAESARRYYDLNAELSRYAAEAPRVDLEKWPTGENVADAKYPENLDTANYAFATKAIADVCAKHGEAILPRLFREIGKTPREKTTIHTVYAAFRKLTGVDLKHYLPKPTAKK